jgi:NAD(P)-dependent dehydrogenase (short-subunit alcohol dehydrogenase family)
MLTDRRILITGAGDGMGRAFAIEAAKQGAALVVIADLKAEASEETARLVREAGAEAVTVIGDLADRKNVRHMVDVAADAGDGIDVLINNAGVLDSQLSDDITLEGMPEEVWDTLIAVNLNAMYFATRYAAPHLRASKRTPAVINAASTASFVGYDAIGYSVTKGAVAQLTRASAVVLAPDVRCNAFAPSGVATPMSLGFLEHAEDRAKTEREMTGAHLLPRMGRPEEAAKLVCFLASEDAAFITGSIYAIDGGALAWRGLRT